MKFICDDVIQQVKQSYEYNQLSNKYQIDQNDYSIGIERVFYSHFNNNLIGRALALPVAADLCFEVDNAIIHIDVKTINSKNKKDGKTNIFVGSNQFSYQSKINILGKETKQIQGNLPLKYSNNKTCLSYFIIVYYDNHANIEKIAFCCLPNGLLKTQYGEKVFSAGKTHKNARFNFEVVNRFELLENQPKRLQIIYEKNQNNENLDFY
ncbi:hypothetical protein [Mycoplasmopsis pullorum]|uniref:hypothetical protein n=1 Tax=Mycoplasmopsis pullorum TaxID=48003 RepID=UPI0011197F0D|nr:hypothetical protein [Mycoplasmopsis pullorum]TNK83281.1 hypothetical protein C4M93_02665 [Mycoplasmopsis pullorum]TNK88079.1 hypothetical protein C4M89_03710 [Mycoplasmopsis pullorum]TNK91784.1 hypothetical protein C4M96_03450 [Mycoplasmopsis pullorum]